MTCSAPDRGSGGGGRPGINRLRSLLSDPLLRHSLLLMATAMLGNAANLVFQIVMNRRLTDVEYGILAAMVALMAILMLPLEALRTTLAHRTAMWMKEGRRAAIRPFYHLWLRRMLLAWAALLVVALLAGPAWGRVFRLGGAAPLWITGVGLSGILLLPVISGVLQGMQRFAAFAWALQIPNIVRFLLGVGLVLWIPRAWAGYSAQAVGFIAAAVCAGYWVRAGWRGWNEPDAPVRASEAYFFKSLIVLGAFAVLMLADVLLVKAWFDEDMAGRYSRAATIARAIVYLPMPVAMALFPKVVSRGERTGEDRRMLVRALAGVGALLAASATAAWVFAPLLWR
ncbi:MAG: hypothetical protein KBA51_09935, partial [Kiritimatiellae bacterium]|nr:hypothetical protein [Kiritimatiellia bacterium]